MSFTEKLIKDTRNGYWDFCWKLNDGSKTYTLNKPRHYLTGLNFSLLNDKKTIVFPNGYGLSTSSLKELEDAVVESLERTMDEMISMYKAGKELTPEAEQAEKEKEKNQKISENKISENKTSENKKEE